MKNKKVCVIGTVFLCVATVIATVLAVIHWKNEKEWEMFLNEKEIFID